LIFAPCGCLAREAAFDAISRQHGARTALIGLNYAVEFRYGLVVDLAERILRGGPIDLTTGYVNLIWQSDAIDHCIRAVEFAATPAVPISLTGAGILSVRALAQHRGELLSAKCQKMAWRCAAKVNVDCNSHISGVTGSVISTLDED